MVTEVKVDGRKRSERATEVCKGSTEHEQLGCRDSTEPGSLGPHQLFVLATQCASVPIIPLVIGRYRYLLRWDVPLHHTDTVMVKRGCEDMQ